MVMAAVAVTGVAVLALGMVSLQATSASEQHRFKQEQRAVLAAEAGLGESFMALQNGEPGELGSVQAPVLLAGGEVIVTTQTFGPNNRLLRVSSGSRLGNSEARAELILQDNVDTPFVWGAFGETSLSMNSQAKVDSYDSTDGSYASQMVNGSGSSAYADDEGNVGSNGDIELSQNSLVYGNATPGESSTITVLGNGDVSGSTANATSPFTLPPLIVPEIPSTGNRVFATDTTLASGQYHMDTTAISTGVTVTVIGPATLVMDSFELLSHSKLRIDSTNGPVDIFVLNDFVMNSNTLIASNDWDPRDVRINLLSDNIVNPEVLIDLDELGFESNAKLYGTIYAPDAAITIESNFELFGSVIAEEVSLSSNCRIHYDEALGEVLPPGTDRYTRISWRVMH